MEDFGEVGHLAGRHLVAKVPAKGQCWTWPPISLATPTKGLVSSGSSRRRWTSIAATVGCFLHRILPRSGGKLGRGSGGRIGWYVPEIARMVENIQMSPYQDIGEFGPERERTGLVSCRIFLSATSLKLVVILPSFECFKMSQE